MGSTGTRFSNVHIKKRKQGNIFSGDRTIDYGSGIKINRSILPSDWAGLNSSNNSSKASLSRFDAKDLNDNVLALKRQIKDLRELLKERDSQILSQKMSLNLNKINDTIDEKETLLQEIKRLNEYITQVLHRKGSPETKNKESLDNMKNEFEGTKAKLTSLEQSKLMVFKIAFYL